METRRKVIATLAGLGAAAGCVGAPPPERGDEDTNDGPPDGTETGPDDDPPPGDDETADHDSTPPSHGPTDPLDDFEDLSRWEVIDGRLSRDPEIAWTGTGSARIDVEDQHARAAIRRALEGGVDLSGRHLHLALRADRTCYPRIRIADATGDYLEFRGVVRGGLPIQPVALGISQVSGSPDLGDIRTLSFYQYVGSGDTARLWLDDLRTSERVTPGIVMIHFDDAVATDYTDAYPILRSHGMAASTFVNPGYLGRTVGGTERLSLDQLDAFAAADWDVCSHTMNHADLTAVDRATVRAEVGDAHRWLVEHGFEAGAGYFVYPYANVDRTALEVAREFHEVAFAGGWPAVGRCRNPALVPRAIGDGGFGEARRAIDRTARFGGITTIFYHELVGDGLKAFERTVAYLADRRDAGALEVRTVSDVADVLVS